MNFQCFYVVVIITSGFTYIFKDKLRLRYDGRGQFHKIIIANELYTFSKMSQASTMINFINIDKLC